MIEPPSFGRIPFMGSRLHQVRDWTSEAREADYCCEAIAVRCGVSSRQLERFFHREFETTPHEFVQAFRMSIARLRLEQGFSTKAVACDLKFSGPSEFCRACKKYFGVPPQSFAPMNQRNGDRLGRDDLKALLNQ